MAEGYLLVNSNRIISEGQRASALCKSLEQLLKELQEAMTGLSACWQGPARETYEDGLAGHMEILSEEYRYMAGFCENFMLSGQDYMRAEQDIYEALD